MNREEAMDLAIQRKDANAMRGCLITFLYSCRDDPKVLAGMVQGMLRCMNNDDVERFLKLSITGAEVIEEPESDKWVESWFSINKET